MVIPNPPKLLVTYFLHSLSTCSSTGSPAGLCSIVDADRRWRRFVFLDVEPMTRVRPDGHLRPDGPDCLHYCLPGVIDYWTLLLASFWMSCRSGLTAV